MNGKTLSYVVVRVSEDIHKLIQTNGNRIFIGLTSHRINDRFYVKACAKCHRYGHYHADCSKKACCGYCTSEEHESKVCPVYVQYLAPRMRVKFEICPRTNKLVISVIPMHYMNFQHCKILSRRLIFFKNENLYIFQTLKVDYKNLSGPQNAGLVFWPL